MNSQTIFDFNADAKLSNWQVVDDVVMGGKSLGTFGLNAEGHGIFKGLVSLENNGGFSSVKYNFDKIFVKNNAKISLKVKGDGKDYQFRIKAKSVESYSYIHTFSTDGSWQTIEIPLNVFYPSFRGRKLDIPNFSENSMEEIAFLIANSKQEKFELVIDKIELI
ncbi:CIA30 family protein [Frigoriflavimonas asaccharolytica]|uniref:NADH:ubiquinone oxidoreductase intermediate-associated protein 30 domain-containing protein n=1 Tax=Frigoriflavimonas asaccharolytica TaxID=2735899 RepID=A0A8J8G4P8_9FLAO|nr:CIA30 family protein [Frigoriflavimonas asaccharolytica]NRS91408.1 hypothetical protein [Frigoriflavimonas asaccharolytica]